MIVSLASGLCIVKACRRGCSLWMSACQRGRRPAFHLLVQNHPELLPTLAPSSQRQCDPEKLSCCRRALLKSTLPTIVSILLALLGRLLLINQACKRPASIHHARCQPKVRPVAAYRDDVRHYLLGWLVCTFQEKQPHGAMHHFCQRPGWRYANDDYLWGASACTQWASLALWLGARFLLQCLWSWLCNLCFLLNHCCWQRLRQSSPFHDDD